MTDHTRPRTRGVRVTVLNDERKLQRGTPSGSYGRLAPPWPEYVRHCIDAGRCPYCDMGPFRVLATHVNRKHGVDRKALRALAGLSRADSICDPSVSQHFKDMRTQDQRHPPPGARVNFERQCVVCGSKVPPTPKRGYVARVTCSNGCDTKRRSQQAKLARAAAPRLERWSKLFDACVRCGTTSQRHAAQGICITCYSKGRKKRK